MASTIMENSTTNGNHCVVPNCKNRITAGIAFPLKKEIRRKWIESLKLNFEPNLTSFVCTNHFNIESTAWATLDYSDDNLPVPEVESEQLESKDESDLLECRLCLAPTRGKIDIFQDESPLIGGAAPRKLAAQILDCISGLRISPHDELPSVICCTCHELISNYTKFRNKALETDLELRRRLRKRRNGAQAVVMKRGRIEGAPVAVSPECRLELMKLVNEKLGAPVENDENVIIQVESDEEAPPKPALDCHMIGNQMIRIGDEEVRLPKGIRLTACNKFRSKTGEFPGEMMKGPLGSEFCLVDNYVFEFALCKGAIRNLKCLSDNCTSMAYQCSDELKIYLICGHNHTPPTDESKKLAVVQYVIRKKIQTDKTQTVRSLYEQILKEDPTIQQMAPLRNVVDEIFGLQYGALNKLLIRNFDQFYNSIELDALEKIHFTFSGQQFYQERLCTEEGAKVVIFANRTSIREFSGSDLMYVDASFRIEIKEDFNFQLITVLVWVEDSYYPIIFALTNTKSLDLYRLLFRYIHDELAPDLRPHEIITDYESNLYYSLNEIYVNVNVGGTVFYYTQNIYKQICRLQLAKLLETNSTLRNIYQMILMLPLLPINTIQDGLENIELQARQAGLENITRPIFSYFRTEWLNRVTPQLFCVHHLENRINENIVAPFRKLRDFLIITKGKVNANKQQIGIVGVCEKLLEFENFLYTTYSTPSRKTFARDLSTAQKKCVLRAWQFIETHPKININLFFNKVVSYIKCMENQLWIWGFYRYNSKCVGNTDELISATHFTMASDSDPVIRNEDGAIVTEMGVKEKDEADEDENDILYVPIDQVVMDVVVSQENDRSILTAVSGDDPLATNLVNIIDDDDDDDDDSDNNANT